MTATAVGSTQLLLDSVSGWRPGPGPSPLPTPVVDGDALVLPAGVNEAVLVTEPLDSGVSRCRWHRVRVDADVPVGAALVVQVTTIGDDPRTVPGDGDWQTVSAAADGRVDFLVDQPPGRYLVARLLLGRSVAASAGPSVRQTRLDVVRATSAELLPAVYREDPTADDFTERFLALFDSVAESLERAAERSPALLDPDGVPDGVLPWLAGLLGLDLDFGTGQDPDRGAAVPTCGAGSGATPEGVSSAVLRRLVSAAPLLRRRRGTPAGLALALEIVLGTRPAIVEPSGPPWGALDSDALLGAVRLFGRGTARARLGGTAVRGTRLGGPCGRAVAGGAPLRSFGDPDDDPVTGVAFRFRVLLPPPPPGTLASRHRATARALVERLAPAHTAASVTVGGGGFIAGERSTVGVDTLLVGPDPAPSGHAALGSGTVLRPDRCGNRGIRLDGRTATGLRTVALDGPGHPSDNDTENDSDSDTDRDCEEGRTP
ncbi:hypothetical protein PGH47_42035 [Streptomyces sp. HUAS 31]|uniref:hypothetical protein n=1 Tax=Streptomyces sp. HUAS 31 TaxID=3020055 RepID=UPI00230687EC|nr:hypothetical protein [Streptomyces sp. HUAS 31]WCE01890.1 hypothetical protein PGH47_42035 [Streptomyces sp. HUAS 31]